MNKFNKDDPFFNINKAKLPPEEEDEKHIYEIRKIEKEEIDTVTSNNIDRSNPKTLELINKEPTNEISAFKYKNLDYIGKDLYLNEEQRDNLRKILFSNYVKLGKYAKKFEDNFIRNIVEVTINKKVENVSDNYVNMPNIKNFITKRELLKYFEDNKKDIVFELFFHYDIYKENKREKSFLRFISSYALSEMGSFWLEFFDPKYSITDPTKKNFINQFKALNYMIYNIKNEDYHKAYACFVNIHPDNMMINKVKCYLEILAKNQIFCDIVENHIDASQYYREEKRYDVYKI